MKDNTSIRGFLPYKLQVLLSFQVTQPWVSSPICIEKKSQKRVLASTTLHWNFRFTMSWQSRIQVLLMNRFRKSLNKWGYGSEDPRKIQSVWQGGAIGGGRAVCLVVSGPWQCAFLGGGMPKSVLWMLWNCFVRHVQHFVHFTLLWMCVFSGKLNELDVTFAKIWLLQHFPQFLGGFSWQAQWSRHFFIPFTVFAESVLFCGAVFSADGALQRYETVAGPWCLAVSVPFCFSL